MARGMKSSFDTHSTYDHVFFWVAIVIAWFDMNNACCIIFGWMELATTTSTKVRKSSLVIKKNQSIKCDERKGGNPHFVQMFHSPKQ
jgi:hypothetical protein